MGIRSSANFALKFFIRVNFLFLSKNRTREVTTIENRVLNMILAVPKIIYLESISGKKQLAYNTNNDLLAALKMIGNTKLVKCSFLIYTLIHLYCIRN